jgi:hypothetical protein
VIWTFLVFRNSVLELFKSCIALIAHTKSKASESHEFALCVLLESAVWYSDFTSDVNRLFIPALQQLAGVHCRCPPASKKSTPTSIRPTYPPRHFNPLTSGSPTHRVIAALSTQSCLEAFLQFSRIWQPLPTLSPTTHADFLMTCTHSMGRRHSKPSI